MERCDNRDAIKCPHCGFLNAMDAEEMPWDDCDIKDHQCYGCNETFDIKADVRIRWTTHKDENDD